MTWFNFPTENEKYFYYYVYRVLYTPTNEETNGGT